MSTIGNLSVKKTDGTTDIVWTAITGSAGDKVPALWRSNTVGANIAVRPDFRLSARSSGQSDAVVRRVQAEFFYPEFVTIDSQQKVVNKAWGSFSFNAPTAMADANRAEASYQFVNLLKAVIADIYLGNPPN